MKNADVVISSFCNSEPYWKYTIHSGPYLKYTIHIFYGVECSNSGLDFQNSIVKNGPLIRWQNQSFLNIKLSQSQLRLTRVLDPRPMKITYVQSSFLHNSCPPPFRCYIYICRSSNYSLMGMVGSYVHLTTLPSEF